MFHVIRRFIRYVRRIGPNDTSECHVSRFTVRGDTIIALGDFYQLPPIRNKEPGHAHVDMDPRWRPFCFDSQIWNDLGLNNPKNIIELTIPQRQKSSETSSSSSTELMMMGGGGGGNGFVNFLNKVRIGDVTNNDITDLNMKCLVDPKTHPLPTDGILPIRLYVLNKDVDAENESSLQNLPGRTVEFHALNTWKEDMPMGTLVSVKKQMMDSLSKEIPDVIQLKVGAQVMLTQNKDLERNLANGSRGVVETFLLGEPDGKTPSVPVVLFDCGITTPISRVESVQYNIDRDSITGVRQPGCLVREQFPL